MPLGQDAATPAAAVRSPRVAAVVPTHDRPELLERTLRAVLSQTRPADRVVVVDDTGSTPPDWFDALAIELAATGAEATWLPRTDGPPGASASRNAGAAFAADAEVLAFCDDDDTWTPEHLARGVAALDAAPPVDLAIGRLVATVGERQAPRAPFPAGLTARDVVERNPGMTGSNLLVRRAAFDAVGGFDAALPVSNDKDLLVRLLLADVRYRPSEGRVEQHRHGGAQLTSWNRRRADGIRAYARKHRALLTPSGRLYLAGQVAAIERRIHPSRVARVGYLAVQLAALRPGQVVRGVRRRRLADAELFT